MRPGGLALDWRDNDFDPEGDTFFLSTVSGANGTVSTEADIDGWFGWVDGFSGGEVRLNAETGEVQVRDSDGDFTNAEFADTSVIYEIRDDTGATDTAEVLVFLDPFE